MTTLSDDVIFWIEIKWNSNHGEPKRTCLTGPFTNSIKDRGLVRKTLDSLCEHSYFKAHGLSKPSITTFDAALADPSYAPLDGMPVKAAYEGCEGRGLLNLALTLRLHHQSSRPIADALRAALGTAMMSYVDLYAVVCYAHDYELGRLNGNLYDTVNSLRCYGSQFIDGFPLPCRPPIQTFLKRTEACALADELLNQRVKESDKVLGLGQIRDEMIGAVESDTRRVVKIVMVMHIFATEHSRPKGNDW
ncbi:hypothetical protein HBI07_110270 [Parastagonospora nodorum]|nr:hypothetical protein HBI07_110270 [Parastagonospora nodorum]